MNQLLLRLRIEFSSSPVSLTGEERGLSAEALAKTYGIGEGAANSEFTSPTPCFAWVPFLSRFAGEDVWSLSPCFS
jgi:hypothetical protein